ncbi:hypothetical protein ABPG72_008925 [Tetrahymena utriculariae]
MLFITSDVNIFGYGNYPWVYLLLVMIDLLLQLQSFIKYILVPVFNGPEYFELYDIKDSYFLTENKHKYQNLRFIKATNQQAISLKLILSSYSKNEIIRVGYYQENYRQFIESTPYQCILFLNKINISEFEEVIETNSINSNILKIKFNNQLSFQDLLLFSKILVKYNAFILISCSNNEYISLNPGIVLYDLYD